MLQRRRLLKLGLGAALVVGVAGGGLALLKPGLVDGRLAPPARRIFRALAPALFDGGLLPDDAAARMALLDALPDRIDASIAAFPAAMRGELSQLLSLLDTSAGRLGLLGFAAGWDEVGTAQLSAALETLRLSGSNTRQQVYHALRDLSSVAFFTDPANWSRAGYPGPREIP
jgi:hypothetical protein